MCNLDGYGNVGRWQWQHEMLRATVGCDLHLESWSSLKASHRYQLFVALLVSIVFCIVNITCSVNTETALTSYVLKFKKAAANPPLFSENFGYENVLGDVYVASR